MLNDSYKRIWQTADYCDTDSLIKVFQEVKQDVRTRFFLISVNMIYTNEAHFW